MKVELKRLEVVQTGYVLAAIYGFFAIILLPVMILVAINTSEGIGMICVLFFYPIGGFIGGIIFAAVYNLIVRFTGGFKFDLDVKPEPSIINGTQAANG